MVVSGSVVEDGESCRRRNRHDATGPGKDAVSGISGRCRRTAGADLHQDVVDAVGRDAVEKHGDPANPRRDAGELNGDTRS